MDAESRKKLKADVDKNWSFAEHYPKTKSANKPSKPFDVWFADKALKLNVPPDDITKLRISIATELDEELEEAEKAAEARNKKLKATYDSLPDPESLALLEGDKKLVDMLFRYIQPSKGSRLQLAVIVGPGRRVAVVDESITDVMHQLSAIYVQPPNGPKMPAWNAAVGQYRRLLKQARKDTQADYLTGTEIKTNGDVTVLKFLPDDKYLAEIIRRALAEDEFRLTNVPIISNDTKEWAYYHLDPSTITEGPTPAYDRWINIFESEDAIETFQAWVWSVCEPKSRSRQILYIYDKDGFTGKTVFFNAFSGWWASDSAGNFTSTIHHDSANSQFTGASLYGSRLILYPDCRNPFVLKSEIIHNISGGDLISIEGKGVNAFAAKIDAKIAMASNIKPEVNLAFLNESSRIIFLEVGHPDEKFMRDYCEPCPDNEEGIQRRSNGAPILVGSDLGKSLEKEMPHILHKCQESYSRLCRTNHMIKIPDSVYDAQLDALSDSTSEIFMELIQQYEVIIEQVPDKVKTFLPANELTLDVEGHMKEHNLRDNVFKKAEFVREFETYLKVRSKQVTRSDGKRPRGYLGVRKISRRQMRQNQQDQQHSMASVASAEEQKQPITSNQ